MKKLFILIGAVAVIVIAVAASRMAPTTGADSVSAEPAVPLTAEEQQVINESKQAVVAAPQAARYVHPRLGFSFEKPQGYTVGSIGGADGAETLVVQPTSGDVHKAFQIYISPLDTPISLTPEFIQKELPGTAVNNAKKITLDGNSGIMFGSNNDSFSGKSYEIWFTGKGQLYQVSSYGDFAGQLQQIIGTWKF